ncbi:MAG: NAD(P)H-hydrate dehydratase [Pseudomonadota bacterium]
MSARILTIAEMRDAEQRVMDAGTPGFDLMRRAGLAVAAKAAAMAPEGAIAVLCGPGNNGGDGYVAAEALRAAGRDVALYSACSVDQLEGDAEIAVAKWAGGVAPLDGARDTDAALIIDALFGAGLSRPLEGLPAELAGYEWSLVVSVDTPSGLSGDGAPPAGPVFRANATVTFAALRPAHVLAETAAYCGEVVIADIGLPANVVAAAGSDLWLNDPDLWLDQFPWPAETSHKHSRGRLMCVTGGPSNTGAARLAARAGLRAGAGAVTLLSPRAAVFVNAIHSTAVMVKAFEDAETLRVAAEPAQCVVIGPAAGVTEATRDNVLALADGPAALVADADALTVFEDAPDTLFAALRPKDVLTPHLGEFKRIFPGVLAGAANRIEATRRAADLAGCVVLLKGPDTVIAAPGGRTVVNRHASPFLATAGSGDVLAGIIGGLIAQGMASFEAACAAAWLHGEAGLSLGPGLIAEDLVEALPTALQALYTPPA